MKLSLEGCRKIIIKNLMWPFFYFLKLPIPLIPSKYLLLIVLSSFLFKHIFLYFIAARLLSFVRSVLDLNYSVKNAMLFITCLSCRRQDEEFNSSILPLSFLCDVRGDRPVWTITCYVYPFLIYILFIYQIIKYTQCPSCR